jgi:hypothetical protein
MAGILSWRGFLSDVSPKRERGTRAVIRARVYDIARPIARKRRTNFNEGEGTTKGTKYTKEVKRKTGRKEVNHPSLSSFSLGALGALGGPFLPEKLRQRCQI